MKDMIKVVVLTILFMTILFCGMLAYVDRIEKIESGKMTLIYQYGGDL